MSYQPRQLDFLAALDAPAPPPSPVRHVRTPRARRGSLAQQSGLAAEEAAARAYAARGATLLAMRWRGKRAHGGSDIDLVVADGDTLVFVEVKCRRTLDEAAFSVTPRQWQRLERAAESYMLSHGTGPDRSLRFDVVLVDHRGALRIVENARPY